MLIVVVRLLTGNLRKCTFKFGLLLQLNFVSALVGLVYDVNAQLELRYHQQRQPEVGLASLELADPIVREQIASGLSFVRWP